MKSKKRLHLRRKICIKCFLNKAGYGKITTEIKALEEFYVAEAYHQDYLKKNPNGYCPNHSTGIKFDKQTQKQVFITPYAGKEIVVIDAKGCPYCEKI